MTLNHDLFQWPVKDMKPRAALCYGCWNNKLWLYASVMPQARLNVLVVRQPSLLEVMAQGELDLQANPEHNGSAIHSQEDCNYE